MIYAINYANEKYRNAQMLNTKTAYMHGADKVIEYSPKDIDAQFYDFNREIFSCERGDGYWIWKPYLIKRTLERVNDEDYLIYSDSGAYYINDIKLLIQCMEKEKTDIMVFSLSEKHLEKMWSKRDAFILMGCDSEEYANTSQRLAGFLLLKKSKLAHAFVTEWLAFAQDIRIISDQPNCMGKENYSGFKENRHDQTILSLLSKKYHLNSFRDPSQLVVKDISKTTVQNNYPQVFHLHRMGDIRTIEELEDRYNVWLRELQKLWYSDKKKILYGAGKNAEKLIEYFNSQDMKIDTCVVSDNQNLKKFIKEEIEIYHISEMPYSVNEVLIIVTVNVKEVIEWLEKEKFDFIQIDKKCWRALDYFEMQRVIQKIDS
jgi:hypothetical protein